MVSPCLCVCRRAAICLVMFVLGCHADRLDATTWTVSNVGACSDTGAGTLALPFCSLQVGIDQARSGDIVEARGGLYGPAQININLSGTASAPITIRSVPRRTAVIVGAAGAGDTAGSGVIINGSYVVFQGFEVRDAAGTGIRNWGSYVTIRDNYVHDNARRCDLLVMPKCGQGIASNGSTPRYGVVIERNLSFRNGTSSSMDHDYYISNPGTIVRNNIAAAAAGFGFQIYPDCDACLIYNNVAYGNANNSGFLLGGNGTTSFSSGLQVYNNISSGNKGYGFWIYHNGTETVVMGRNIVSANTAGAILVTSSNPPSNTGMLAVDPLLVDPGGLDFHISGASPAIDAGSASYIPPDDIDGEARISGLAVDIGADEFVPAVPPEAATDLRFIDATTMVWAASSQATSYALYRGSLTGWPWGFNHTCLQPGLGGTGAIDSAVPSAGMLSYYLVSGVNSMGEGNLGWTSVAGLRPNVNPCP